MRIWEITSLLEANVGQNSPVGSTIRKDKRRNLAKQKVEALVTEEQLDELDWKKAARTGALAAATAFGSAGMPTDSVAAPYQHTQNVDQMSGENKGTVSTVQSDNGNASLTFRWKQKEAIIQIPGAIFNYGLNGVSGRIKIGNDKVEPVWIAKSSTGSYSVGFLNGNNNLLTRLMSAGGQVKIEVPMYQKGDIVYNFTIEPDNLSKTLTSKTQAQDKDIATAANNAKKVKDKADSEARINADRGADISRAQSKIRGNLVLPPDISGNLETKFLLTMLPTGEIGDIRLSQSSGDSKFDAAVDRAIKRSSPLPKPDTFTRTLEISIGSGR
jgi:TonB family protein